MVEQPSGTVTLVFTDIEGSTRLLHELGPGRYREALAEHRRLLRGAFARNGGGGDGLRGGGFLHALVRGGAGGEAPARRAEDRTRVRWGRHTGEPLLDPPKYVGVDVHLAARVMSAGHG